MNHITNFFDKAEIILKLFEFIFYNLFKCTIWPQKYALEIQHALCRCKSLSFYLYDHVIYYQIFLVKWTCQQYREITKYRAFGSWSAHLLD